jgi:hypothetical protein
MPSKAGTARAKTTEIERLRAEGIGATEIALNTSA